MQFALLSLAAMALTALAAPKPVILDQNVKSMRLINLSPTLYVLEFKNIDTLINRDDAHLRPDIIGPTRVQDVRFKFDYRDDHLIIGGQKVKSGVTQIYAMGMIPDYNKPSLFSEGIVDMEVDVLMERTRHETYVHMQVMLLEIDGYKMSAISAQIDLVAENMNNQISTHGEHQAFKFEKSMYLFMLIFAGVWVMCFVIGSIVAMMLGRRPSYQPIAASEAEAAIKSNKLLAEEEHDFRPARYIWVCLDLKFLSEQDFVDHVRA